MSSRWTKNQQTFVGLCIALTALTDFLVFFVENAKTLTSFVLVYALHFFICTFIEMQQLIWWFGTFMTVDHVRWQIFPRFSYKKNLVITIFVKLLISHMSAMVFFLEFIVLHHLFYYNYISSDNVVVAICKYKMSHLREGQKINFFVENYLCCQSSNTIFTLEVHNMHLATILVS